MPIPGEHIFGWDEAPPDEKLQALYDWCNLLTGEVNAARADTRALLERVQEIGKRRRNQDRVVDGSAQGTWGSCALRRPEGEERRTASFIDSHQPPKAREPRESLKRPDCSAVEPPPKPNAGRRLALAAHAR